MSMTQAKAFAVTEHSRPILQCFIVEQIPEDTKYVLASSEGYLFFNEEPSMWDPKDRTLRIPTFAMLTYYDVEYES